MYDKFKESISDTTEQIKTNVYGKKEHMSFKLLFKDSIRYSFGKPINIILLGFFLLLVSLSDDFFIYAFNSNSLFLVIIFFFVFSLLFSIYESGYSFIIFHNSINGSDVPPSPLALKEILHHGINDFIVILIYVMLIIIIQYFINTLVYVQTNILLILILRVLNFIIVACYIFVINLSLINLAIHDGDLKAAFDVFDFKRLFQNIGAWRFCVVLVILAILEYCISDIFTFQDGWGLTLIFSLISVFILTPAFTLFTKRFLVMAVMH